MAKTKNIKQKMSKSSRAGTKSVKLANKSIQKTIKSSQNHTKSTKSSIKSSQNTVKSDVKKTTKSAATTTKSVKKTALLTKSLGIVKRSFVNVFGALGTVIKDHQSRRPHRSFRHTPRKIHQRPLQIEGYFKFSRMVLGQLWRERRFFLTLLGVTLLTGVLLTGVTPQERYNNLKTALDQTYQGGNGLGDNFFKTSLLLISTASGGGFNPIDTEGKQLLTGFLFMVAWLTTVWYLRNRLAGHQVKFRDSLYNACSPLVATILIAVYMLLQLMPMLIFTIFYAAAISSGTVGNGLGMMLLQSAMVLVAALTIYWIEGSFLALIVATLPGIYPMQALKIAGDLTVGRRLKILFRLIWHVMQVIGLWAVTALPIALAYGKFSEKWSWLKGLPIIPAVVTILSVGSLLWTYVYIYFLYRRLIEDESQPA